MTLQAAAPARVHLADPDADVMLLDAPVNCPVFVGLRLLGVAANPTAQHYLVVELDRPGCGTQTIHIGPDDEAIARRSFLLVAGMLSHRDIVLPEAACSMTWLAECWTILDEQLQQAR